MDELEFIKSVKQEVIVAILGDDELNDRLVLKGGNLLQFAYELSVRASKDVDISIDEDFASPNELETRVRQCLEVAFSKRGMVTFDFSFEEVPPKLTNDLRHFWGGYQCFFKLIDRDKYSACNGEINELRKHAEVFDRMERRKFRIDFSRHEFCDEKQEFQIGDRTIFGYSPEMFVAEKIRAICQQMPEYNPIVHRSHSTAARARDFVDIHVISEHYAVDFGRESFQETARKIFGKKHVPLELIGRIQYCRDQHEPDFASVRDTVAPRFDLQEFDFYFDYVCRQCQKLEPLWNK